MSTDLRNQDHARASSDDMLQSRAPTREQDGLTSPISQRINIVTIDEPLPDNDSQLTLPFSIDNWIAANSTVRASSEVEISDRARQQRFRHWLAECSLTLDELLPVAKKSGELLRIVLGTVLGIALVVVYAVTEIPLTLYGGLTLLGVTGVKEVIQAVVESKSQK